MGRPQTRLILLQKPPRRFDIVYDAKAPPLHRRGREIDSFPETLVRSQFRVLGKFPSFGGVAVVSPWRDQLTGWFWQKASFCSRIKI
jgi:hypothetical protein